MNNTSTVAAARRAPRLRAVAAAAAVGMLAGCAAISEYVPSIPVPSMRWLWGDSKTPGPMPDLKASATATVNMQVGVGQAMPGFAPAVLSDAIYAAAVDGSISRINPVNGSVVWRINAGKKLSAGPGAASDTVVVGTEKGEVLAFDDGGKPKWTVTVSTEVVAPPKVADEVVIVFAGDGSIHALDAATGAKKWVHQRVAPALTVRNFAGGVIARGALFTGTAGGRLLAIDVKTGIVGWDATVASPKGSTELERIADVTGLPLVSEQHACAAAYQGRIACFDVTRGTLNWSRDVSSLSGIAGDARNIYITDDRGAVHALDRTTGATVWKQDLLAPRKIGGPQLVSDLVGVVDPQGFLHLLSPENGAYVGRLATDGSPPTSQPELFLGSALWQSASGTMFAVSAK